MKLSLKVKDLEPLLKKSEQNVRIRSNLYVLEGKGLREVEFVGRVPGIGEIGRVRTKVVDKVLNIYKTHNKVTSLGLINYLYSIANALGYGVPISFTTTGSTYPSISGIYILAYPQSGTPIQVPVVILLQIVNQNLAVVFVVGTINASSNTVLSLLQFYESFVYVRAGSPSAGIINLYYYSNPVLFAEANVNITLQAGQAYTIVWEFLINYNYSFQGSYNSITWLTFLFYNSYRIASNYGSLSYIVTVPGSSNSVCGLSFSATSSISNDGFVYVASNGNVYFVIDVLLSNPVTQQGVSGSIYGLVYLLLNGYLLGYGSSGGTGCGAVFIAPASQVPINISSSQLPIVTYLISITVQSS
ncbi:hypothetical protein SBFV2_gp49 [Sulfolobales Beppu filamentous virus 2]|uniref:Uncharacterized protein n=1 Tax=Sulfolobales Beppu filamentous virus 2 TaxID=2493123 RepID=A0A3S8NEX5_9VIRU|nr:hypothetical protein HOU84_gp49 [Sulfolobales Beppu filamentous virus 2]AZI75816.1 hypothetical protein SBFV2_gp49 [Sulfolobales Beppu filamentous virus 2]